MLFSMNLSNANENNIFERRKKLISLIDIELAEVIRLNGQTNARNPGLLLRMAELLLEKARLVKENENLKYLTLSPKKRRITNKKNFFKQSRQYFIKAQNTAQLILKRFKKFKQMGDIYYILAFNEREFGREDRAKTYFLKSIKKSKRGSESYRRSKLALAEIYFNKQKYKKALPLYKDSLAGTKDKWWTKDAINYAWCLFNLRKKSQAIKVMREVYTLSKKNDYIDVSSLAGRDLALFYSSSGKTTAAVKFYKSIGGNVSANLITVGKLLLDQGKFSSAEKTFAEAEKYSTKDFDKIEIYMSLLTLYEKFGRVKKHLKIAKKLSTLKEKGKLDVTQSEILIYQIKKYASLLQNQVVGKVYRHQKKTRIKKAKNAVAYFLLLKNITPKNAYMRDFHIAETYFAIGYYNTAAPFYYDSLLGATAKRDKKLRALALNGLTICLSKKTIKKSIQDKFLIPVYISNINNNPKSKESFSIYQRLFSLYLMQNDMNNAEKILYQFKSSFPGSVSKQEAMLAQIMDFYKDKGDTKQVKRWVAKINKGEFRVSKKYIKKLKILLLTMQFEGVEKANSVGDKKLALRGYVEIYKDVKSSKDAKRNAAYNISILFHELGYAEKNYSWSERALSEMTGKEVRKFSGSFLTMAGDLFNRQYFTLSASLYKLVFHKLCRISFKDKAIFFKNAIVTYLANNKIDETKKLIRKASTCHMPKDIIVVAELDLLKALGEQKYWNQFNDTINKLSRSKKLWPRLISHIDKLRKVYESSGQNKLALKLKNKILRYYKYSLNKNYSIPLESLDIVAAIKFNQLLHYEKKLAGIKLTFPEERFSKKLSQKFDVLTMLTTNALEILKIGSGKGIVASYNFLVRNYAALVREVETFTPPNKSEGYIKGFRRGMRNKVINPLKKQSLDYRREAKKQINSSQILSKNNYQFLNNLKLPFNIEYISSYKGIIMDKGGRK